MKSAILLFRLKEIQRENKCQTDLKKNVFVYIFQ